MPVPAQRSLSVLSLVALLAIGPAVVHPRAQSGPLPDPQLFAARVKEKLLQMRDVESQYTYLEHRQDIDVSAFGGVTSGPVRVFQVFPSAQPGQTYKRLISVDGKPLSEAELEKQDRKHRDDLLKEAEKRRTESPGDRAKRVREEAKDRQEIVDSINELFQLYTITMVGRETLNGTDVIVATLEPKPDYRPRTDAGRLMKKLRGRAWVSEADYEVVRIEGESIDDLTYGWGLAARLHKGAKGTYERRKVNGAVWLPAKITLRGTGRALLFRTFELNTVTTYSDYKKFNVSTEEAFTSK